jgi:hypothetical protein
VEVNLVELEAKYNKELADEVKYYVNAGESVVDIKVTDPEYVQVFLQDKDASLLRVIAYCMGHVTNNWFTSYTFKHFIKLGAAEN